MTMFNEQFPEYIFPDPEPLGEKPYLEWEAAFEKWEAAFDFSE